MKYSYIGVVAAAAVALVAAQPGDPDQYHQCGGIGWTGPTTCSSYSTCSTLHSYFAECIRTAQDPTSTVAPTTPRTTPARTTTKKTKKWVRDSEAKPTTKSVKTTKTTKTTRTTKTIKSTTTKTSKTTKTTKTTKTSRTSSMSTPSPTSLDALIKAKGKKYIGVVIDWNLLEIPQYEAIVKSEFGSVTAAEWSMKWEYIQPSRGTFVWDTTDTIINWAVANGKNIRGHALVWHQQLPQWVKDITDPAELRTVIIEHITTYASRYAGKIEAWDVVNEVFEDDGQWRASEFYNVLGPEYVEIAFRAAQAADPHAKLCINDYNFEWNNGKINSTIALVNELKARGVKVNCIGAQAHLVLDSEDNPFLQQHWDRLSAETGAELQLTELDIRMKMPPTEEKLQLQRRDYARAVAACMNNPNCTSITLWGITDALTWWPNIFPDEGAPLPWDANYTKKPAYHGIVDGINAGSVTNLGWEW